MTKNAPSKDISVLINHVATGDAAKLRQELQDGSMADLHALAQEIPKDNATKKQFERVADLRNAIHEKKEAIIQETRARIEALKPSVDHVAHVLAHETGALREMEEHGRQIDTQIRLAGGTSAAPTNPAVEKAKTVATGLVDRITKLPVVGPVVSGIISAFGGLSGFGGTISRMAQYGFYSTLSSSLRTMPFLAELKEWSDDRLNVIKAASLISRVIPKDRSVDTSSIQTENLRTFILAHPTDWQATLTALTKRALDATKANPSVPLKWDDIMKEEPKEKKPPEKKNIA